MTVLYGYACRRVRFQAVFLDRLSTDLADAIRSLLDSVKSGLHFTELVVELAHYAGVFLELLKLVCDLVVIGGVDFHASARRFPTAGARRIALADGSELTLKLILLDNEPFFEMVSIFFVHGRILAHKCLLFKPIRYVRQGRFVISEDEAIIVYE